MAEPEVRAEGVTVLSEGVDPLAEQVSPINCASRYIAANYFSQHRFHPRPSGPPREDMDIRREKRTHQIKAQLVEAVGQEEAIPNRDRDK